LGPRTGVALAPRRRTIHLDGWRDVPVYSIEELASGQEIEGRALIEADTTTILLRNGDHVWRWLDISVGTTSR
jgi:N-methylhydantoinase A